MNYEFVDQITLPRHEKYIDHGASRRVIAMKRDNSVLMYIRKGYSSPSCGVRGFGSDYNQSALIIKKNSGEQDIYYLGHVIAEGRISKSKLLYDLMNEIERGFDVMDFVHLIDMKKTLIID